MSDTLVFFFVANTADFLSDFWRFLMRFAWGDIGEKYPCCNFFVKKTKKVSLIKN